jgi:hypothetical protein
LKIAKLDGLGASGAVKMMSWRRLRRERIAWADTVGDAFIAELGIDAYSKARGLRRDAATCELTTHWALVAQTIARKMRKGAGLDRAAHMEKDSGSSTALKTRGDLPRAQTPANIEPPRMGIATSEANTLEPT